MKKKRRKQSPLMVMVSLTALSGTPFFPAAAQSLSCPQPLIYGEIVPCGATNTVTVRPDNTRQVSGCLSAGGAPFSRARCVINQGYPTSPIQITVSAPATLTTGGGNNMAHGSPQIVTNAGGCCTTKTGFFVTVPIGATLTVGAGQAGGTYTGTFTVNAVLQ